MADKQSDKIAIVLKIREISPLVASWVETRFKHGDSIETVKLALTLIRESING